MNTMKRKEKTTPFGVNLMRSPVLYRAAQEMNTMQCYLQMRDCGAGQQYKSRKMTAITITITIMQSMTRQLAASSAIEDAISYITDHKG